MSNADPGRISEQHTAYRRGLVLGLTMAEAGILIIFVLLLLLAHSAIRQARLLNGNALIPKSRLEELKQLEASLGTNTLVPEARLKELTQTESKMAELRKALGVDAAAPVVEIEKLVRVAREAAATAKGQAALEEARKSLDEIQIAKAEIKRASSDPELPNKVEEQAFLIANKEGQLRYVEQKLAQAGGGKESRPCWVQPDGKIDYLFDVVLTNSGIRMREIEHLSRTIERSRLPMPAVDPRESLSPKRFTDSTDGLFERSQQDNCRFFVVLYDATGPTEKALYKSLRQTVEGHFYLRIDNGAPPF